MNRTTLLALLALAPAVALAGEAAAPSPAVPVTGTPVAPAPGTSAVPAGANPPGGAAEVPTVHWSDLKVKVFASVRDEDYPSAARNDGLPDTRCTFTVSVDEAGVPSAVEPLVCDPVFQESGRAVLMRFRFYPYKLDGVATAVRFEYAITFRNNPTTRRRR
jgi:hypothetical protein